MTTYVEEIVKAVMGAYEYCNTPHLLEAIWQLDHPTWLIEDGERKRTVRFCKGQMSAFMYQKHSPQLLQMAKSNTLMEKYWT